MNERKKEKEGGEREREGERGGEGVMSQKPIYSALET